MNKSLNTILKEYQGKSISLHYDSKSDSIFILCIHNIITNKSIGGCRWLNFNSLEEAVLESIRLAEVMSYKNTLSNVNFGGAKAIILNNNVSIKREVVLQQYGEFVNSFKGNYITSVDSGTNSDDMYVLKSITPYVTGYINQVKDQYDPSYYTALGVYYAMKAALFFREKNKSLYNKKIFIQGMGKTGFALAKLLSSEGALIDFYDTNKERVKLALDNIKGIKKISSMTNISSIESDIFSPCALSNVINNQNIHNLKTKIIVGTANNQLEDESLAEKLNDKGIIYCPDFLVNSGGVIYATQAYLSDYNKIKYKSENTFKKVRDLFDITLRILERAQSSSSTPLKIIKSII